MKCGRILLFNESIEYSGRNGWMIIEIQLIVGVDLNLVLGWFEDHIAHPDSPPLVLDSRSVMMNLIVITLGDCLSACPRIEDIFLLTNFSDASAFLCDILIFRNSLHVGMG